MSTEAKCPFSGDARKHTVAGAPIERRLVAQSTEAEDPAPALLAVRSHGRGVQLRRGVQEPRPECRDQGPPCADDGFAGLVAGGLRPLRTVVHSHGMAQRRHVPHRRRSRRRRDRQPALCAPQQLAGQRQPRQGAPAALADQAEVRPEDLLGRPDDPRRQRRAGVDGIQDLRFRRRARGHLGTGRRHLLGLREQVAGRQALLRRPGSRESARRRADGPDLRESGRPERQPGSARRGAGHPRDLRPHGDERRRDGCAHRRRSHLRQDPRRRRCETCGARAGSGRHRGAGPRLEEQLRHRQRRRHDHQRPGSHLDHHADEVEQQLLLEPVRLRMGTDEEPGRCASVEAEAWRGRRHRAGCPRPVEASRAVHADHGPRPAVRPCLRKDFEALSRESGSVRGRIRPGVVQADAPRHGPARALSRPARSAGSS